MDVTLLRSMEQVLFQGSISANEAVPATMIRWLDLRPCSRTPMRSRATFGTSSAVRSAKHGLRADPVSAWQEPERACLTRSSGGLRRASSNTSPWSSSAVAVRLLASDFLSGRQPALDPRSMPASSRSSVACEDCSRLSESGRKSRSRFQGIVGLGTQCSGWIPRKCQSRRRPGFVICRPSIGAAHSSFVTAASIDSSCLSVTRRTTVGCWRPIARIFALPSHSTPARCSPTYAEGRLQLQVGSSSCRSLRSR